MLRLTLFAFLVLAGHALRAQKMYEISLANELVSVDSIRYSIVDVVDGRNDKLSIGWVQTGIANKKKFARFPQPADSEIMQLLRRSGIIRDEGPKVVLRIEYLAVSEQTRAMSETARAQVTLDLFRIDGDQAVLVGREYATVEDRGMDVTSMHAGNIARAIGNILTAFNKYDLSGAAEENRVASVDGVASFSDDAHVELAAPVYMVTQYPEGLYASFDEFRNNMPSITDGYEVQDGKQVKVRWVDGGGRKKRVRENVYALAHGNRLYIFFSDNFYLIEKQSNGFYFHGPDVPDAGAVIAGGVLGGALGGAIVGAATATNTIYRIDLTNGAIKAVGVR